MSIISSRQALLLASVSFIGLAASGHRALANPEGGTVEAGSATIGSADSTTLEINQQSQRAIINWDSFSIGEGETTRFVLPNSQSVTLNRDLGGVRSEILGNIESNGRFFLVNPNGILFGPGSRVDVAGLVATTHDIRSQDFMAGRYEFNIPGQPDASVITQGDVSIQDLGFGAFVAPHVRNEGVIAARMGRVELASASGFTLDMHGDRLISFLVENPNEHQIFDADGNPVSALVENTGEVVADGGVVAMSASAARGVVDSVINTDGIVQANTVEQRGGKIILGGGSTGTVRTSGQVQARGTNSGERGGRVEVTGEAVIAEGNSEIDASGMDGGGTILFGGDYLGGNTKAEILHLGIALEEDDVPTSRFAFVDDGARMSVDALGHGDGGKLIVWSDEATLSFGDLSARGGPLGGDGGFIETSGEYLEVAGNADASAPAGRAGTWLLDPMNIAIDDLTNGRVDISFGESFQLSDGGSYLGTGFRPTDNTAVVSASMIEGQLNLGTSVVVTTFGSVGPGMGDIFLRRDITKTSGGDARFVLAAEGAIIVSAGVNVRSNSGALTFELFAPESVIQAGNMGQIRLNGGDLNLTFRNGISLTASSGMNGQVNLNHANASVGSGRVDLRFGQNRANYTYTANSVEYRTGAVDLRDPRSNGGLNMNFEVPVEARYHNLSVVHDQNHGFYIGPLRSAGAVQSSALDGIPEIISGTSLQTPFFAEPSSGIVPVNEVSLTFSERVDDYRIRAASGEAILDAHLASLRPRAPVEQVVQQAVREPRPSTGLQNNPEGQSSTVSMTEVKMNMGYNGLTLAQREEMLNFLGDLDKSSTNLLRLTLDTSNETMLNLKDIVLAGIKSGTIKAAETTAENMLEYGASLINPKLGVAFNIMHEYKEFLTPIQAVHDEDYWALAEWVAKQTYTLPIKLIGVSKVGALGCTTGLYGCVVGANVGWDVGGVAAGGIDGSIDALGSLIGAAISGE